jgi:hypothetical protein
VTSPPCLLKVPRFMSASGGQRYRLVELERLPQQAVDGGSEIVPVRARPFLVLVRLVAGLDGALDLPVGLAVDEVGQKELLDEPLDLGRVCEFTGGSLVGVEVGLSPSRARMALDWDMAARSNSLRARYGRHCRPRATHRTAAFAFQLAREATGKTVASYRAGADSRAGLMLDPPSLRIEPRSGERRWP